MNEGIYILYYNVMTFYAPNEHSKNNSAQDLTMHVISLHGPSYPRSGGTFGIIVMGGHG